MPLAELDMSDILSDAFFAEAFAQELPAFEMMYMCVGSISFHAQRTQQVNNVSQAVQGPMPRIWADELPSQTGLRDARWRRIHEAVQRKAEKARARAAGQVPSKPHRRFLHRQAQRWSLLWALLADLLRPDPAAFVLVDEQERIVCIAPSTSSGPSRALVPFEQPGRQQRLQASLQGDGLQLAAQPAACAGGEEQER
ncbi:J domain-containing protein [Haematococcus lacustris]|uniref:J domain-containing protein n=1 Tax=Haematococcus lacustris TaxID=44745 RepID=A0A699ZCH3_HAELA|nr:J domain-containing protein [Haematococcus lacustris]